jgi:hypothetical protein
VDDVAATCRQAATAGPRSRDRSRVPDWIGLRCSYRWRGRTAQQVWNDPCGSHAGERRVAGEGRDADGQERCGANRTGAAHEYQAQEVRAQLPTPIRPARKRRALRSMARTAHCFRRALSPVLERRMGRYRRAAQLAAERAVWVAEPLGVASPHDDASSKFHRPCDITPRRSCLAAVSTPAFQWPRIVGWDRWAC